MEVTENGTLALPVKTTSPVLHALAVFFSYLLHPLLLIGWITLYLLYINDSVFLGMDAADRLLVFLRVFSTSIFLPLITVLLLKGLGFISSIQLKTQKERIIPYVACITFFFWSYYVSRQLNDPRELQAFLLALFVTASVSLVINNYFKISMHTLGGGSMIALFVLMLFSNKVNDGFTLSIVFLAAGIMGSSRLLTKNHHPFEVYSGFVTGFVLQLISWYIVH